MTVVLTPTANMNVRSGPGLSHPIVRTALPGQRLESLEAPAAALAKIGQQGQWLHVSLPGGGDGYAAAWLLEVLEGGEAAPPPAPPPAVVDDPALVTVTPTAAINLRAGPDTTYTVVGGAQPGDPLESLEHRDVTFAKVGQQGEWLNIRLPDERAAWAAAWLLEIVQDVVAPVTAAPTSAPAVTPEPAVDLPEPADLAPAEAEPVDDTPQEVTRQMTDAVALDEVAAEVEPQAPPAAEAEPFDLPDLDDLAPDEQVATEAVPQPPDVQAEVAEAVVEDVAATEVEPQAPPAAEFEPFDLPDLDDLAPDEQAATEATAQPPDVQAEVAEAIVEDVAATEVEPQAPPAAEFEPFDLPDLDDLAPDEQVATEAPAAAPAAEESPIILTPTVVLNVRSGPGMGHGIIAVVQPGDRLTALDSSADVGARLGQQNQFIHVALSDGRDAYTAAWLLAVVEAAPAKAPTESMGDARAAIEADYPVPPPLMDQQPVIIVTPTDALNARSGPDTSFSVIGVARPGDRLTSLEDEATTRAKLGQMRQWLNVRLPDGKAVYTAAWVLTLLAEEVQNVAPPVSTARLVAAEDVNARSGPGEAYRIVGGFFAGDAVTALETDATVAARLGQPDQWLRVRLPNSGAGWAAAWCLQPEAAALSTAAPEAVEEAAPPAEVPAVPAELAAALMTSEPTPPESEAEAVEEAAPPAEIPAVPAAPAALLLVSEPTPTEPEAEAVEEAAPPTGDVAVVEAVTPPEVVLLTPTTTDLSIRSGPSTDTDRLAGALNPGDRLESLEDPATTRAKIGVNGKWLNVRLVDGRSVFVAAWLVKEVSADELPPPPPTPHIGRQEVAVADRALTLIAKGVSALNLRAGPGSAYAIVTTAQPGEPLEVLEAAAAVEARMKNGQNWVFVRTAQGTLGWAAAWLVDVLARGHVSGADRPVIQLPDPSEVPSDPDEGRKRALDFYHDPCFVNLPVCNPAEVGSFSGFGPNNFSYRIRDKDLYKWFGRLHNGLDFGAPIGTMLCAMDWGVVMHVSADGVDYDNPYRAGPYSVIIRHADTLVLYGHMNGARQGVDMFVKEGEIVQPGQRLGRSGTFNQFAHLHIEMRRIPADYIERLRTMAQAAGGDLLEGMDKQFRQRGLLGWIQPLDNWLNLAYCFNPPLETYWQQYGWAHAASEQDADQDNNGFVDRVVLGGHTMPITYDLYNILSIPPGTNFNFWAGSHTI